MNKTLMLGSAQWGWTLPKKEVFLLLDAWLKAGFRRLDCATNYPINRNPEDFRVAEMMLQEYTGAHGIQDLELTYKIGSLDNLRSPDVNLSPSFIQMMAEESLRVFGSNLACLMFHWDNRDTVADIQHSLEALQAVQLRFGIRPGLSGIAHPKAYDQANRELQLDFEIQLKHNLLHSDLARYKALQGDKPPVFFAYGINAGGLKLQSPYPADSTFLARGGQPEKVEVLLNRIRELLPVWNTAFVRPPLNTMNQLGLIYAAFHPDIQGIVLGVSSATQLKETLDFWRNFEVFDYTDVFSTLKKILLPGNPLTP